MRTGKIDLYMIESWIESSTHIHRMVNAAETLKGPLWGIKPIATKRIIKQLESLARQCDESKRRFNKAEAALRTRARAIHRQLLERNRRKEQGRSGLLPTGPGSSTPMNS